MLTRSKTRVPITLVNVQIPKKAQDILTHLISVFDFLRISGKREGEILEESLD